MRAKSSMDPDQKQIVHLIFLIPRSLRMQNPSKSSSLLRAWGLHHNTLLAVSEFSSFGLLAYTFPHESEW